MKATIVSTDRIVSMNGTDARVWKGVTAAGVPFVAYITRVQVDKTADNSQFERELIEYKPPEAATRRAIDMRHF